MRLAEQNNICLAHHGKQGRFVHETPAVHVPDLSNQWMANLRLDSHEQSIGMRAIRKQQRKE
jgi:hypothetical protein